MTALERLCLFMLHLPKYFDSVLLGSPGACGDKVKLLTALVGFTDKEEQSCFYYSKTKSRVNVCLSKWEYTTGDTALCLMFVGTVLGWPH